MGGEWIALSILLAIIAYLLVVILHPALELPAVPIGGATAGSGPPPACRRDVEIRVEKDHIAAWFYVPAGTGPFPCVVMATGLGGTKDALLERFALRYVENGIAVLTFDYRHFGESSGEPRQLFDGIKQQEDLRAVVEYALESPVVDPKRIVLWSTSSAGRYSINGAAEDPAIAGAIAMCPSLDHRLDDRAAFRRGGIPYFAQLFVHAQRDKGRSRLRLSTHRIPIVSEPGGLAFLNAPCALEGYRSAMAGSRTFVNGICGRSLLIWPGPDTAKMAPRVRCPVLLQVCLRDGIVDPASHKKTADILGGRARVIEYAAGHFDLYRDPWFAVAAEDQVAFVRQVCGMGSGPEQ